MTWAKKSNWVTEEPTPFTMSSETGGINHSTESTLKSDILKVPFTNMYNNDVIMTHANCNYYNSELKHSKGGGCDTFIRHMEKKHYDNLGHSQTQSQIRCAIDEGTGS